jgi:acyl-CoA thioesterase-2
VSITLRPVTDLRGLLELESVKPDAFLGSGPDLKWGRIYGGQVVAQAFRAAVLTVESGFLPHSLHAYFVRAGNERQPVLYEVERVRDGRSFCTRQVVAYQANGAILNLIASFQVVESGENAQAIGPSFDPPDPATVASDETDLFFERKTVRYTKSPKPRVSGWMRVTEELGDDPLVHACALAYLSDEYPLGAAILPHSLSPDWEGLMTASLDHAVWLQRPVDIADWMFLELRPVSVAGTRGVFTGTIHSRAGALAAYLTQEALLRPQP